MRGLVLLFLLWVFAFGTPQPKDTPSAFDAGIMKIEEEKYLGNRVADVSFISEEGKEQRLYDFIKGKPTALILAYYTCDSACPLIVKSALEATKDLGKDANLLVLSFDKEDTLQDIKRFKSQLGISNPRWTFGIMSEDQINKLTQSLGYRFFYSRRDRVFVHPNVVMFIAPDGKIVRYLYGISPRERDFRIALAEAETFRITRNTFVDVAYMVCYKYDPETGKYGLNPAIIFAFGGVMLASLTLLHAILRRKKEVKT
ncbi:MAG: SCO family protein [Aquificaceae bacterium]|nr:SCO family protein [Aquificaceae bacterium]MCS7196165.1 SCO family protein [Aquificaceae bacterium]MCX7989329.1 SCO family protein [Aquificaceae bacterium]MDW8032612.1 SCO family protein [Aquificaceae bacterium]MDW8294779.1 SCO family protein [Aquificaceae bacterium]